METAKRSSFKHILCKTFLKELPRYKEMTKTGVKESTLQLIEEVPNVISIYVANYKFCVDIIKGMYVLSENDFTDEFDYYIGHKVVAEEEKYEFNPKEPMVNWKYVREMDQAIHYVYSSTYNTVMYGAKSLGQKANRKNPEIENTLKSLLYTKDMVADVYPIRIRKQLVDKVGEIYTKNMLELFRIDSSEESKTFITKPQPSYTNQTDIIIYTQTGFPENHYGLDCSDKEFYLIFNPLTLGWEYNTNFPWVSQSVDLFSPIPGNIDESLDFKSAIQIICEKTSCDMVELYSTNNLLAFFTLDEEDVGFETNWDKVMLVTKTFLSDLVLNYPSEKFGSDLSSADTGKWFTARNCKNGITRVFIGSLIIDIAIEYCGVVDIALEKEVHHESWDNILYCDCSQLVDNYSEPSDKDNELVHYLTCENLESKALMEDITNSITRTLYMVNNND